MSIFFYICKCDQLCFLYNYKQTKFPTLYSCTCWRTSRRGTVGHTSSDDPGKEFASTKTGQNRQLSCQKFIYKPKATSRTKKTWRRRPVHVSSPAVWYPFRWYVVNTPINISIGAHIHAPVNGVRLIYHWSRIAINITCFPRLSLFTCQASRRIINE